ncbi:MAG: hypothetical protein WEE89_15225 [Gemmatimonadota bacterium]
MPADITITDTRLYTVRPNTPVEIKVAIGDRQAGGTSLMYKGVERTAGTGFEPIGAPGEDVRFNVLHCVTTVRDIDPDHNHTSVKYTLRGGPVEQEYPFQMEVSADGHARYVIDFVFVQ